MAPLRLPIAFAVVFLLSGSSLPAQRASSRLFGTVLNVRTQAPIADAEIIHLGDGRIVKSDSLGLYRFDQLGPGLVRFLVRAPRFPSKTFVVALTANEALEYDVEVDSAGAQDAAAAQKLPTVAVRTDPPLGPRYAEFEARRLRGRGQYLTRKQIEQTGLSRLHEVLGTLRGVAVACTGGLAGCTVRMVRAPMRCLPRYIVDERVDNEFGPYVALKDIQGVEVYSGPSDVPAEWAGSNAGCGLIVIWTQSGPARARKPAAPKPAKPDSSAKPAQPN